MSKGIPKGSIVISVPPELREKAVAVLRGGPINLNCAARMFLWALAKDPKNVVPWLLRAGIEEVTEPVPETGQAPLLRRLHPLRKRSPA